MGSAIKRIQGGALGSDGVANGDGYIPGGPGLIGFVSSLSTSLLHVYLTLTHCCFLQNILPPRQFFFSRASSSSSWPLSCVFPPTSFFLLPDPMVFCCQCCFTDLLPLLPAAAAACWLPTFPAVLLLLVRWFAAGVAVLFCCWYGDLPLLTARLLDCCCYPAFIACQPFVHPPSLKMKNRHGDIDRDS